MSVEISGLGLNTAIPAIKSTDTNSAADFSSILKKSSATSGTDLDALFEAASQKYNVPVSLLKAVAKAESNFNPNATSPCGAMGIMQLMPGTAEGLGVSNAYDPEQGIMGGSQYLSQLLTQFNGNTKLAVAAYNAGPEAVDQYGGIPPYAETQNYVQTVMGYLGENISAGSITSGNLSPLISAASGLTNSAGLGTALESSLLSGGLGDDSDGSDSSGGLDLSSLLGSLNSSDPKDISNKAMASLYQMQLQMMQGDSQNGDSVIV